MDEVPMGRTELRQRVEEKSEKSSHTSIHLQRKETPPRKKKRGESVTLKGFFGLHRWNELKPLVRNWSPYSSIERKAPVAFPNSILASEKELLGSYVSIRIMGTCTARSRRPTIRPKGGLINTPTAKEKRKGKGREDRERELRNCWIFGYQKSRGRGTF